MQGGITSIWGMVLTCDSTGSTYLIYEQVSPSLFDQNSKKRKKLKDKKKKKTAMPSELLSSQTPKKSFSNDLDISYIAGNQHLCFLRNYLCLQLIDSISFRYTTCDSNVF